jgi:hypothetical protein
METSVLRRSETTVGLAFLVAFISAQFFYGISAAVKVLGIACLVTGVIWIVGRSIPVGIEGRPPSHFVRGLPATLAGMAVIVVGIALLCYSRQAACFLGWSGETDCR